MSCCPLWTWHIPVTHTHTHLSTDGVVTPSTRRASWALACSPIADKQREVEWSRGSSVFFLPFSTSTSAPTASSPSAPLLLGGSSPSNSWFTSPWMSEGRRLPSLLQTVNLWLMVVAGETSDGVFLPRWLEGWRTRRQREIALASLGYCSPPSTRLTSSLETTMTGASSRSSSGNWTCDADWTVSSTGVWCRRAPLGPRVDGFRPCVFQGKRKHTRTTNSLLFDLTSFQLVYRVMFFYNFVLTTAIQSNAANLRFQIGVARQPDGDDLSLHLLPLSGSVFWWKNSLTCK